MSNRPDNQPNEKSLPKVAQSDCEHPAVNSIIPYNQADWVTAFIEKYIPGDEDAPPREWSEIKAEAHKILTTKIAESLITELKRVLRDGGLELDLKRKDGNDAHTYVDNRIAELEAGLRGKE